MLSSNEILNKQMKISSSNPRTAATSAVSYCDIDLNRQRVVNKKIVDEEYLRALKVHQDPRKLETDVPFEVLSSVERLVKQKMRPMSVEPSQRYSFENWAHLKSTQKKLTKRYLSKERKKSNANQHGFQPESSLNTNERHFNHWLKKKIKQIKKEKLEKNLIIFEELERKEKLLNGGMGYKEWLKISLAKEKEERERRKFVEERNEIMRQEVEEQKSYEKKARRYIEKMRRVERLSKLSMKRDFRDSELQPEFKTPLLLAYSPNKKSRNSDQSLSRQSKYSPSPFEDY